MNELLEECCDAKLELRKRIVAKAIDAFTNNGIKSVTMDEIASLVGISKRTLYETFEDKEDLLLACVIRKHDEYRGMGVRVVEESNNVLEVILHFYKMNIDFFHRVNRLFFEDIKRYSKVGELIKRHQEEHSHHVVAFYNKGVDQGLFRKDVNFEITNILVREQVNLLIKTDLSEKYSFVEVYESIIFTFLRGVSTDKGQEILEKFLKDSKGQR